MFTKMVPVCVLEERHGIDLRQVIVSVHCQTLPITSTSHSITSALINMALKIIIASGTLLKRKILKIHKVGLS